ncbi:MAG: hypothetical protein A3C53_06150 [Omnitrophica WOR_2 bacterium RIFCSPHIGHO2_02_FULL_68_15]|nr:MAG: hypothetical protein A3C53_06150 [Omnitrophica WOR_2 bacterium RIFCSPHIGHO2_02_FULL_68_15]
MRGMIWLLAVVASLLVPAACWWATTPSRRRCRTWDQRRLAALETARALHQRRQTLQQEQRMLEQTMSQLAGLYDLTKQLLVTLDRHEAARGLADALADAFPRVAFRLAFMDQEGPSPSIASVLQLREDGVVEGTAGPEDRWLSARLLQQPMIWSSYPMVGMVSTVDLERPEGLERATAFPLLLDGALQGFLVAVQLPPRDADRCGILVSQFALAVRRIRLYERVQALAIRDGLTGVFIRRYFLSRLQEEVTRAAWHDHALAFLMVDLDHFKRVNDTYGHLVGDAVLREIAALLRTQVREVDLVGRYGGEEFGIGLLDTGRDAAQVVAERIRQAAATATFRACHEPLTLTVSIGIAAFPQDAADAAELIAHADAAMYHAKEAGRNRVSAYAGLPRP